MPVFRRRYVARDVILSEGEKGDAMYVVRTGEVVIKRGYVTARRWWHFRRDGVDRRLAAKCDRGCQDRLRGGADQSEELRLAPYFAIAVMRALANRLRCIDEVI